MLYVIPTHVINGIFEGLFLLILFSGAIALSSKTGFIYAASASHASKVRLYTDKSKLPLFFQLLLITFILSTVLAITLYGFDLTYFGEAVVWAVFIATPSAIPYWCLLILKTKDKKPQAN